MKRDWTVARLAVLCAGFAFLYGPIVLVVIYSFNGSRLVTVWGGWSTRWYGALFANRQLMASAATSLEAAIASGAIATILGTLAALALDRFGRFRSRGLFAGAIYAPLVLPEVVMGLALLLFFVASGVERGFVTLVVAHATLSLGFVAILVRARLAGFDRSLEEAASDLGAGPATAFMRVTLPLIAPAVATGFLLAVTLSLDDLILASFNTGPGSTTLPMRIYSEVRLGVTPQINAMSTLLIGFVGTSLLLAALIGRSPRGQLEGSAGRGARD
ncbi:ABC transporter permease [Methylocapsa acidiphila]|uniref:ABC transporter permease n=1 Tax=Methylocapsa acidiphila TaxID=133552 RepID=UPI0004211A9E|nr:ABC transporter permease [Methylocapsa acidiphila]